MSITFFCPTCQKAYTAEDQDAGKAIACKVCGARTEIPVIQEQPESPIPPGVRKAVNFIATPSQSGRFNVVGAIILAVGIIITLYFGLIYDTAPYFTHNIGLMQNRWVGIVIGIAMSIGGILVGIFFRKAQH